MCGIFFALSTKQHVKPSAELLIALQHRGPDATTVLTRQERVYSIDKSEIQYFLTFASTVLSLRGDTVVQQPYLETQNASILCWNGEAWHIGGQQINGNDTKQIFELLDKTGARNTLETITQTLAVVAGPYAFVYYDQPQQRIYLARDFLGRRSLLWHVNHEGDLLISSVSTGDAWTEIDADGIYCIDLQDLANGNVHFGSYGHITYEECKTYNGGLDCTVLARISHDLLPHDEPIDLLNVAFENPRVHKNTSESPYELCPDRITGRASFQELLRTCPGRPWRLVAVNIPYTETQAHRETVMSLMHPHNTEMDLSISFALYFASRGQGLFHTVEEADIPYTTSARVLLSGLGADELFAGYTRHATAFKRNGFDGLFEELDLDIGRLGRRNLGRDDRIISHWSKEVRFPYLDEELVYWALNTSVTEKTGYGHEWSTAADGTSLEPGKKILRCLAWQLGMTEVAKEKKRAIQFGARTAKMETGKTKGTTLLTP